MALNVAHAAVIENGICRNTRVFVGIVSAWLCSIIERRPYHQANASEGDILRGEPFAGPASEGKFYRHLVCEEINNPSKGGIDVGNA